MFSEQDVDRELKAAMSVSPSADFEARVLRRVEEDRPTRVGLFSAGRFGMDRFTVGGALKTPALLAAAASIIIVAGLFYALNRTPVVVAPPTIPPIAERTALPVTTTPVPPDVPAVKRPPVRTVHAGRRAPSASLPPVIVEVNQMEAVRRLVRAVNEGRVDSIPPPPDAPAATPDDVLVTPLVVERLIVPTLDAAVSMPPLSKAIEKE
jgi:hypothetical protein